MWTMSTNLKENKMIGQRLADIRQREHPQCVLCNLVSHVSCSRFIPNTFVRFSTAFASILKHLYHLKNRFARIVKPFTSIHKVSIFPLPIISFL